MDDFHRSRLAFMWRGASNTALLPQLSVSPFELALPSRSKRYIGLAARGVGLDTYRASAAYPPPFPEQRPSTKQRGLNIQLVKSGYVAAIIDTGEHDGGHAVSSFFCSCLAVPADAAARR